MKYHNVNNVPGNYEGMYNERVDQSRDTREIINSFTPNQIYKPFSNTIKVPPIEDPIILNPNYKNILAYNEINNDDFELRRKELAVKIIVERLKYVQSRDNKNSLYPNKYTQKNETKRNKLQNIETAETHKNKVLEWEDKRESKKDLHTIKMTALNIIDENIKKAVSVAEQIKQEIDVEMTGKQQERRELTETKESYEKNSKKKECVQKSLQKQSFSLGKQTIPYMKFYMQSNNFNTMLIKRIFLQLTNFMVSLTKYLSRNSNIFHTSRKSLDYNSFNGEIGDLEGEYNEDLILSGAEMSRKFGKTPLEFTKRMDTVIMEFEKRTGIEHNMTIRRSRSRSRSTVKDKLVNDDFIDHRKENIDGKNTYRAFVTEEWSEYYDLRQPEINKTLKSEKYMESETIKKETIEKLVEEKIQKEFPITYIAIVQAHVFTNQDAIIRDTQEDKCEQHRTTDTLHSKKESLIQEREQNALYTDLEYQLIRINKKQPVEKEVVVESIEDITPVEEYKMFPALEQVKGVAVQKTTELLEPIMEIEIEKQKNILKARPTIQPSNISIASIEPVVLQEDKDNSFILPEIKHRKSITLFEEPFKPIAEKTNIETFEPRVEIININQNALAKPISSFEAPSKSIAQVSQVELIEPQSRPLKLEMPIEGRSKELVQTPIQSVAVNIETITESPKIDFICAPQPKTETSNILVEPLSTTVAKKSEVYIDESTVSLDKTELNHTHVKQAIVPPLQLVAQKLEANLDESCANFNNRKMQTEPFQQTFEQPLKVVAQTLETSTDVANLSIFKTDSVLGENSKTYFEVPCQTVAQVGEIYSETAATLFEEHKNNEENIKMSVEIPNKSIAEKLEISEEEVIQPYLSEHRLEKIKKSMEPGKYVAEKYDIQMNDIGEEFYEFKAKTTEPEITIETPIRLTAETNVTLSDEAMGFVEKNKNLLETIKPHSVPAFKPVAEVSLTVTNETSGIYEKSKLKARNSLFQVEAPIGTVAEISEPHLHELSEIFDKKLKLNSTEKPNTSVEITFKTVPEISEVILSDFSENITMPVTNSDKTKIVLEIPVKTVAEKSETYVDKLETQTFQSDQINTEMPSSTIETPIQTVAEKSIITADEPKPYNLEIDTYTKKSPKLLMEESQRFIPEIEDLILEGPKLESFDMPKIHEVEANIAVDKLEPTTITQILLAEPSQIPFDVPQVQIKVPRPLIEEPLLTVPEVSMLSLEGPKDGILVVSKSSEAHACLALQNSDAASVFETAILEPQCDLLETPQIKERQHHRSIEEIKLTVSDIQENVILGPKDDVLLTPLIVKTNASLNIDEQKALEGSLIISEENIEKHPDLKIDIRQPKIFVEECTKTVAENVQIRTAESEKSLCVVSDVIEKVAGITVQSVQSVAKIDEIIALSSVTDENFHTSQDIKKIKSKVESFETLKATINEIDIRDSKVEITEVIDDKCEEVAVNYKAKDETKKIMSKNNKKVLELDADFIEKDIEFMEHGMSSIIQSVDERVISKSSKKSTLVASEVKLSESESSKSPSPTSPINDVYFFCVETPYSRHEPEAATAIVELDFKSTPKRRYTQAEISVAQSIGITYEVSDSEDEVEIIEVDYEKHQYESDINMGAVITERKIESRKEQQFSENAIENHQHNEVNGVMQFKNKSAIIDSQSRIEKTSKSQASLESSRQAITETNQHQAHQLSSKRKSAKSKEQSSKSCQKREALHTESQEGSIEISGSFQTQITQSEIQSVEQHRQDIKVIEKEFESRHALLEHDITSMQLESKEKLAIKQIERGLHEQVTVDSQELKSPPIEPATPLTDEYVFRLTAPFPPSREGTPVPRDCTSSSSSESEEEIRRKLIPHMDLSIEQRIYDPPLPTPPTSPPVTSPVTSVTSSSRSKPLYSKPGLRGGGDTFDLTKEDVLEIGRQSNLLASAIDKTIKRIEEYKSQAGIMEYASSEISSSESRTVNEFRCEDSKVEVLIDKMVETSRRLSGDVEDSENSKEVIIPIVQDAATEEAQEMSEDTTIYASKEERKMETSKLSEQLLNSVQGMVDPNASLEERLKQMNSQIDELSKLPDLIHKTLNEVKVQFEQLNYQLQQKSSESQTCQIENSEQVQTLEKVKETPQEQPTIEITAKDVQETIEEIPEPDTEIQNIIDKRRLEAESKTRDEIMKERLSQELRIAAERLSPKLGLEDRSKMPEHRPYMSFSPLPQTTPAEVSPMGVSPSVSLPMSVPPKSIVAQGTPTAPAGETARPGKVWKKSDNYDDANLEQMLSETLAAQAEVIKGKAIGVNFMKYEKPPPALDHLQNSEVYKAIHEMDQKPLKKVEMLKPAIAASDYVERLRSASPTPAKTLIEDCEV